MKLVAPIVLAFALVVAAPPAAVAQTDPRALSSYMKGVFLESRYDLVHAYSWYMYADRFAPRTARIHLRLARVTLELGDLGKARDFASRLIGIENYDSEARLILAEAQYRAGDPAAALESLDALDGREDVPLFEMLKFRAKIYLETDRIDEARDALEEAATLFDDDLYVHYKLGFLYARQGDADRAIASFRRAIELNPGLAGAHVALGSILAHEGRRDEAKEAYRRALEVEPDNRTAMVELAGLLVDGDEIDEGIRLLEKMRSDEQLDANGLITLGRFYYRAGRREEALGVFRRLLAEDGERPSLLRIVSELEVEGGNHRTARQYLERLVRIEPDVFNNYVGLLLLGFDLAGAPSSPAEAAAIPEEEALGYLQRAEALVDPDAPQDNYLLGAIRRQRGDGAMAEEYLLRAERFAPEDRRILLEVATLYEQRGDWDPALERLSRLHELFPGDASLQNFYGYVLAEKGERLDFAEELLVRALAAEPDNGYYLDSLGWIKYRQGEYREAVDLLLDAVVKANDDSVIWEHLGDAWDKLGDREKADDAWRRSVEIDPKNESAGGKLGRGESGGD
ncbi:MAG: tetratricopeptide repeat protein [Candidatus Krumholzibacteriota bacterium]|nr:tetratricopeptide repeat protein [Candidatus Krumholzibacteriota bacterium]